MGRGPMQGQRADNSQNSPKMPVEGEGGNLLVKTPKTYTTITHRVSRKSKTASDGLQTQAI